MTGAPPNPTLGAKPRRWTTLAAAWLLVALALVVMYTGRGAFYSPLALVVVSAIGLAALLLQLRLREDLARTIHAPRWLNVVGVIFAVAAVFADFLHLSPGRTLIAALVAVTCFAISGVVVLDALRKQPK